MDNIRQCVINLLSMEWDGKPVWERIRDDELTSAPAFKGKLYDKMPVKIMYVGHAVNGWEIDTNDCQTLERTVDTVLNQDGALETFVNAEGYPYTMKNGNIGVYYHINSKFFRLIKQILEFQNESDSPTTHDTWYHDSKEWNQKFVWSNLYNIAPKKGGNPDNKLIKLGMSQYTEQIRLQIEMYKPNIVVFFPLSGYFIPWKRQPSFVDILDYYEICKDGSPIIGKGSIGQTHIIVCKRPDAYGMSHEDVRKMAVIISEYINSVCRKQCE